MTKYTRAERKSTLERYCFIQENDDEIHEGGEKVHLRAVLLHSHAHAEDRSAETYRHEISGWGAPGPGGHEVDSEGATLSIGRIGWGVVRGLTVVKHDAARRQLNDHGSRLVDLTTAIQEYIRAFVGQRLQV